MDFRLIRKTFQTYARLISYRTHASLTGIEKENSKVVKSSEPPIYKQISLSDKTITEHIWNNVERWPDKIAVECGITNRRYTYQQLYKLSRNFASNLKMKYNINEGDVVCIMMNNCPEYAIAVLGSLEDGAVVTTINPIYTSHEVHRQIILTAPKIIIGSKESVQVIKSSFELGTKPIPIVSLASKGEPFDPDTTSFWELLEKKYEHSTCKVDLDNLSFLLCSSGTTGLPKGVELLNRNIVSNLIQQDCNKLKHYTETTALHQDSVLAVLPFYHVYGLVVILLHKLAAGLKILTLPSFKPDTFLSAIKDKKINIVYTAPPIVSFLANHASVQKQHLTYVRTIISGGAPLPSTDIYKILNNYEPNLEFKQVYGLTETSPLVTTSRPGNKNYSNVGEPVPNTELRIVDTDSGESLKENKIGELHVRGPQVMKGYLNNPKATKEVLGVDGWFKTGDLAYLDETGQLNIVDRLKELIKVKGYQVSPAELESVLKEHPDVLDAAVVGIPDKKMGEAPKGFIVVKPGSNSKPEQILDFVSERVAIYKKIKNLVIVDSIPRNPSGKILRKDLKKETL